ncbi:hypothetical protein BGW37DRAFT_491961 [Umbelopsis sp. PMI_123]|nr:hypothetical protein BGW37DRAFT_491961 [Umbelopsis sp. PMI_123]
MSTLDRIYRVAYQTIGTLAVVGFYGTIFCFVAGSLISTAWLEIMYVRKVTNLVSTNCTILRASIGSGDDGTSWFIHVNYTIPLSSSNFIESHVTSLQDTDINAIYKVNETLPCFYSKYDLDYATLYNGPPSVGTIFVMIFFCAFSLPFVLVPAGSLIYLLVSCAPSFLAILRSTTESVSQLGSVVADLSIKIARKWKRFTPLAQSEEEAHDLETTDDVATELSSTSPV